MIFKEKCKRDRTCIRDNGHSGDCEFTKWPTTDELSKMKDEMQQVGGDHYTKRGMQPWEVIELCGFDFWEGNVIKYLMRYPYKNGPEDLKKARHYLDYLIAREEKNE
jgi:hypothetical protein